MSTPPVLVVGAGPTGLNLSLALACRKIPHRLLSEASGPGEHSRAMVVHARTLEFYNQLGFADELISQGIIADKAHVRGSSGAGTNHEALTASFRNLGDGLSPYPFMLAYPQDDHERFLIRKLEDLGVSVEWGAKLISFEEQDSAIEATIEHSDGHREQARASYICGCDGAHSQVRNTLQISFPGGTYDQLFYVADVRIESGFDRDFHVNLGEHILALMLPVRLSGMQRLIGLVPPELSNRSDLTFDDIRGHIEPLLAVRVTEVNWFSTYRVHHRIAGQFRVGRAFISGDAAHIHSPAGGQGMNTGIGDATNLGWKLANVLQGRADASLLDSYEPERIGFARSLVSTTDRAFTGMVAPGLMGEFARRIAAPFFFGIATRFHQGRHAIFRLLSQTRIHYPDSPLSEGQAGGVHGGDRLPWTGIGSGPDDNFAPLRSLDWQAHIYGASQPDLQTACRELGLKLHQFPWTEGASKSGLKRDALYLIRPDGYVALAASDQPVDRLKAFVARLNLSFNS